VCFRVIVVTSSVGGARDRAAQAQQKQFYAAGWSVPTVPILEIARVSRYEGAEAIANVLHSESPDGRWDAGTMRCDPDVQEDLNRLGYGALGNVL
jgi:hypothetical protein